MGLGEKAAGLALAERAIAANSVEKDAVSRPAPIQVLAAVEAQMGEPDRAIAALRQLLSILLLTDTAAPLTSALLRLDPMFDPLQNDPHFPRARRSIPDKMRPLLTFVVARRWFKLVPNSSRAPRTRFC